MTDTETIERLEEMQATFGFVTGGMKSETLDNAIKAVKFQETIKDIIENAHNRIMELYGSLIIEGYADIFEDIKREVEKCEDAG